MGVVESSLRLETAFKVIDVNWPQNNHVNRIMPVTNPD
jgi:hypothetical protein